MTRFAGPALGAIAMGFAIAASPAAAQQAQGQLGQEEVRAFFQRLQREANEAVRAGDAQRLMAFTRDRVADGAEFSVTMEVLQQDRRLFFGTATVRKEDAVGLHQMLSQGMDLGRALENYSLAIEVTEVRPVGPNAAIARTRMTDSGALRLPAPQAQAGQQQARAVRFERNINCTHLVQRGAGQDQLALGLTNCQGEARLQ